MKNNVMVNALTIDVEDYFQVAAFSGNINPDDWNKYPLRVVDNTLKIMDLLDEYSIKATFFILGWVAKKAPSLVKRILKNNHEIACHGYDHKLIYNLGPKLFRKDIRKAKMILEDISGTRIYGYRAPSYSITLNSLWALDILIEEGFTYDSSIFPVIHDLYGIKGAERFPHRIKKKSGFIYEFPLSTMKFKFSRLQYNLPIAGGGYLRLFPVPLIAGAMNYVNCFEKKPVIFYFHPWEIDPNQPRINSGYKSKFRHYHNLHKMLDKVKYLLNNFRFGKLCEIQI